jgi:hypothetical protein
MVDGARAEIPPGNMTRREAGWMVLRAAAVTGGAEFFNSWLKAQSASPNSYAHESHTSAPPEPDRWSSYEPKFFSKDEIRALDEFTAILIPTDETPGAREAHVAQFIDFVVNAAAEYAPEMQDQWREAMHWLSAHQFGALSAKQQQSLVHAMSGPERDRSRHHDGFPTYRLIKEMAVHAFYTSRVGLVDVLEYRGNAYLTQFPGCTHPEHRRV